MALPAYALATLAEFKDYYVLTGAARDAAVERAIERASQDVEAWPDRRLIYRAPTEDDDNVVASANIATGALAVAGQPNSAGRTLVVTKTDADHSLTAGVLTVTGTVGGVLGVTETFDLYAGGDVQHGVKFFTAVSAAALAGVAGQAAGDVVKVGTSVGYTEYHSPCSGDSDIRPIEWPVQNVIEVNEDINRVFAAATALTVTTAYEVRQPSTIKRRITRVSNTLEFPFYSGRRVIRLRYSAGYKGCNGVPPKVKGVCLELAAWYFQQSEKKEFGLVSRSDAMGSVTRTGPPILTRGMQEHLTEYLRGEFTTNAERDFDTEAA